MTVRELKQMLKGMAGDAEIVVNIDGDDISLDGFESDDRTNIVRLYARDTDTVEELDFNGHGFPQAGNLFEEEAS